MTNLNKACYLVTGGAGFIGSHIVSHLVAVGADVRVLDDFSTGTPDNLTPYLDCIELIEGSVTDRPTCERVCRGVDYVLHQAALPSVQRSVESPLQSHEVNATGTLNMLLASRDNRVRRFVYAGSSSAYGDTPSLPKREDMPPAPRSPYAVAKLVGEQYARVFAGVFGLETITLRYFNVFGPRQDPHSPYSAVIPKFMTCAGERRAPTINGDGEQTRDFTYVQNVVRANLCACHADLGGHEGQVFNVGCGKRISINDLWNEIAETAKVRVPADHGPARPGDVRHSLADLTKIRSVLGYKIEVSLVEGLERTWNALNGQPESRSVGDAA